MRRASPADLASFITRAFVAAGLPTGDAEDVAARMVEADVIGADAHGVFRLPQYVTRLKLGSTNPRPSIKVKRTAPATALVDGDTRPLSYQGGINRAFGPARGSIEFVPLDIFAAATAPWEAIPLLYWLVVRSRNF